LGEDSRACGKSLVQKKENPANGKSGEEKKSAERLHRTRSEKAQKRRNIDREVVIDNQMKRGKRKARHFEWVLRRGRIHFPN